MVVLTAFELTLIERKEVTRYNPKDRIFAKVIGSHWIKLSRGKQTDFILRCYKAGRDQLLRSRSPTKVSKTCLIQWRRRGRESVAMIGDLDSGYMITPVSKITKAVLQNSARDRGVSYRVHQMLTCDSGLRWGRIEARFA